VSIQTIAFIGLGIMGRPIALNLMKAGFRIRAWARHPEKIAGMAAAGAVLCSSKSEAVSTADAVITMLGAPDDVEQVYFGPDGILESAAAGTFLIDMTTSSPALARRLHDEGRSRGLHMLDAPVTGGRRGAEEGSLAIFVGGDSADFEVCRPIFEACGKKAVLMGPAGSGQNAKMANQILVAGTLTGICESLAYARRTGLDLNELFPLLCAGSGGSRQLEKAGPKIIAGDDAPSFFVRYLAKDLRIAVSEAQHAGLDLSSARHTLKALDVLTDRGMGDLGTQALIHFYEE
jgi:3-hydroxyisobutyrate dehydrogenase